MKVEEDLVYNENGTFVGTMAQAKILWDKGIEPKKIHPEDGCFSIGFCDSEQKWYGWTKHEMFGFGIGHITKKENGECREDSILNNPDTRMPMGFECKTLEDCKKCAIGFADRVI